MNSAKSQDHNSSRSNKSSSIAAPDNNPGSENPGSGKAQDHNSSRSNKTSSKVDQGNGSDNDTEKNNTTDKKTDTSEAARAKRP
jgi:hypothetical protein